MRRDQNGRLGHRRAAQNETTALERHREHAVSNQNGRLASARSFRESFPIVIFDL